jgi:hypothetical protein
MVPTLRSTWGLKGQRLAVDTSDDKRCIYAYASLNVVGGALTTGVVELLPKRQRPDEVSKNRVLQDGFLTHLHAVARAYPASRYKRVVLIIDNAAWHGGSRVREALAQHPQLELFRLPSYSPQLNTIERFWRILRRRAAHNRFFDTLETLKNRLRKNFCYGQAMKRRLLSLIDSPKKRSRVAGA